jgi:histidyl-tRNA synthetase
VDIVGEEGVGADAEVLAVALDALRAFGLGEEHVRARVSDRRLLAALLTATGLPPGRHLAAFGVIDKLEREERARSLARFREECGLDDSGAGAVLELFEADNLEEVATAFATDRGVSERLEVLHEYREILEGLGLAGFLDFDLRIVRGLAYYTGIVFEIFDSQGAFRAVCGGGRYDRLLELVGGEPLPAVGFGMGDVVLAELLGARGLHPQYEREVDLFVVCVAPELRPLLLEIVRSQRAAGRSVVYPLRAQPVRKQFSSASTEGARHVIILGPSEAERGVAVVRDMKSGAEAEAPLELLRRGEGLDENGG